MIKITVFRENVNVKMGICKNRNLYKKNQSNILKNINLDKNIFLTFKILDKMLLVLN